jgi:hypothetical protein
MGGSSKKQSYYLSIWGIIFLGLIFSCSKKSSGGGEGLSLLQIPDVDGTYMIDFNPLNSSLSGMTLGSGKLNLLSDHFSIGFDVKDSPGGTLHKQGLYFADRCPTESDDLNQDGFIDELELSALLGDVLLKLDSHLGLNSEETGTFPQSDTFGHYNFYKEESFSRLKSFIFSPVLSPDDHVRKLTPGEVLRLDGLVIILFGLPEEAYLPGSIRSLGLDSDRSSFPIACAKLIKMAYQETETTESK